MQLSIASSSLVSIPVIEALMASDHTIVSIITNPDKVAGRGQKVMPNELAAWANLNGLPVAKPADTSELNRHLLDAQPQLIVTVAYGRIIPVELLHGPRFGWINLHFSLLPKLRGAAPVQWALLNGDINADDTTTTLLDRLSHNSVTDLLELLSVIGKTRATPQPLTGATFAPKISKDMGRISWSSPTEEILRKDRALGENPGIWSTFNGERISLFGLKESLESNSLKFTGEIELNADALLIRTSDSVIEIGEVTPASKKRMSGSDFARGARLVTGSQFE